jgi:OPT family oligopeptide transporter
MAEVELSSQEDVQSTWDPNASTSTTNPPEYKPDPETATATEVSPYPEVAASVSAIDDEADTPVNTFRVWFLGMIFVTIGSGLNMLFSMRNPPIIITSIVCQLLSFPLGKGLAKIPGPRWFNPGPFTMKEHTVITIMSNVSFAGGQVYASSIILAQKQFYHQDFGWGFQILLTWTTQIIGYGLAGIARKYLVWPAAMIWPTNLVQCALFRALHREAEPAVQGWTISRYRFFLYVMLGSFVWYWLPGYIFQALSAFAFVTWIVPNNVRANIVFGQWTVSFFHSHFFSSSLFDYSYRDESASYHF